MDELTYHYKPNLNQLDHVSDKVDEDGITTNADDIKTQVANNYSYNSIGQLVSNTEEGINYMYNASGLVTEVQKDNLPLVKFYYNDKGHRVRKESFANGTLTSTDHYVRDAAGSTLAIYNNSTIKEMPIYGASRLGVYYTPPSGKPEGKYVYQLTDHLGNVRAVIAKVNNNAAISSSTDYYPFGMPMPGRQTIGGETYRYAFQGQENDPETGKEAFELRLWDSRIGRWLSPDPAKQFSSPYLGMGNNPVNGIDPDGGKFFDWYEVLDADGNGTGEYEWFDGSFDIEGYKHIGFDLVESNTDINNNTTTIKYDGATKSSYLYNRETAKYDFIKSFDRDVALIDKITPFLNAPNIIFDQFSGVLVNGFQGAGIALYEGANGRNLNGLNVESLGYKPALDITSTRVFNNGKWVNINLHSVSEKEFFKIYAGSLLRIAPFKANLVKNKAVDGIISSKMKSSVRDYIENN